MGKNVFEPGAALISEVHASINIDKFQRQWRAVKVLMEVWNSVESMQAAM